MQADGPYDRNWEQPQPDPWPRTDARFASIDQALIRADDLQSTRSFADSVDSFARRVWSLPTFSRFYGAHLGAAGSGSSVALTHTLRRLEGKFVIANQRCSVSLPEESRRRLHDPTIFGIGVASARWYAFILQEPMAVTIQHASNAGLSADAAVPAHFFATVPYRLLAIAGKATFENANEETDWVGAAIQKPRLTASCQWFRVGLCIPDVDALRQMTAQAALFYRWITGRLGSASREQYWHLDGWEQYMEHGRVAGVLVPELIGQQRLASQVSLPTADQTDPLDGYGGYGGSRWPMLTRGFDRRASVPPGYCFVEFTATLSIEIGVLSE